MISKVLFVGGFKDGKWIEVHYEEFGELPTQWIVAHRPNVTVVKSTDLTNMNMAAEPITREIYKRMLWVSGSLKRFIYAHNTLSYEDVLNLLIKNYKP